MTKKKQQQVATNVPLYEYECSACNKTFEVFIGMNDTQESCIFCESKNINKVMSSFSSKIKKDDFQAKAGDVVKKHIKEASEELRKEKEKSKKAHE